MATPSTSYYAPGPGNAFVPEATGDMQVEFSRNPTDFALNQYVRIVPGSPKAGYYPDIDTLEAVRLVATSDYIWPEGQDAPKGDPRGVRWKPFTCNRHAYPFTIGQMTQNVAHYDVVGSHSRMVGTKAMTARSVDATTVLTTAANWPAASTSATVDALLGDTGDSWYSSSAAELHIRKSFNLILQAILKNTGGTVKPGDVRCVINPNTARQMSETAEVHAYLTAHEQAMSNLADMQFLSAWMLPPILYGVRIVVEDAVRVTTRYDTDDTGTTTFALADDKAVFVSQPDGLMAPEGSNAPSFSTITGFMHEDFTVEAEDENWDRRTKGRVVDDRDFRLTAPASGYLMQDVST